MIQIFGKAKCFDTRKACRWFSERRIPYQMIDFKTRGPSRGELQSILRAVGGLDALLDPNAKDAALIRYLAREEDKIEKVLEDATLLRTPIVRQGNRAVVGFCPDVWKEWL